MSAGFVLYAMIVVSGAAQPYLEDGKNKPFINEAQCHRFVDQVLSNQYEVESYECFNERGWTAQSTKPLVLPPKVEMPVLSKKEIGTPYMTQDEFIEDKVKKDFYNKQGGATQAFKEGFIKEMQRPYVEQPEEQDI